MSPNLESPADPVSQRSPVLVTPTTDSSSIDGQSILNGHRQNGTFNSPIRSSPAINSHPARQQTTVNSKQLSDASNLIQKSAVHRLNATGSVQAIAIDDDVIFAGLQGGEIVAWCLKTYEQLTRVHAHTQSVLDLSLSEDKKLLFSSGVDSVVNVWSASSLERLYSLHSHFEIGDIFCVTFSSRTRTLFCGAQNSSIQWFELEPKDAVEQESSFLPSSRKHRFFDSLGPGGTPSPLPQPDKLDGTTRPDTGHVLTFPTTNYHPYAHKSYIYSIRLVKGVHTNDVDQEVLITAGGGGTIKLWSIDRVKEKGLVLLEKFKNKSTSVHSLAYKAPFLYVGLAKGIAHIYNLASKQLVHKWQLGCGDVLQIQVSNGSALCGTGDGWIKRSSNRFTEVDHWKAHQGKILATAISTSNQQNLLITGGNDNTIALWEIQDEHLSPEKSTQHSNDELVNSLRQFVSYRSVASNQSCISDCHQAAMFLKKQFSLFGATTSFLTPGEGVNPILLAKFLASTQTSSTKTVLFYGHYDTVDAEYDPSNNPGKWQTDPFVLYPSDGYLYGRGVTDNKGPILAALYATADLAQQGELSCNVTFLLEGDEEAGSRGLTSAVRNHKQAIGDADFVMLSNSYWLDDHIPCLTYGMRGVVHASVTVKSDRPDLHSGVDGKSLQHEPLKDLTVLLSSLIGPNGVDIKIPNFYKAIDKMHQEELDVYSDLTSKLVIGHPEITDKESFTQSLIQKWRQPNLTIHQIQVPEAKTAVTIARTAKAFLSVRIVPSQSAEKIATELQNYLQERFAQMKSTNQIEVVVTSQADPWLGRINNEIYSLFREAIAEVWDAENSSARPFPATALEASKRPQYRRGSSLITSGTFTPINMPREPLLIREGGSIPAISFLEREFNAPAVMFPMGQASDNAHLDNERIRLENLYKGREILRHVFSQL